MSMGWDGSNSNERRLLQKHLDAPAHVSKKLGTKTGCHDANLWTCLAFQHVAVARQNQASGQLLAVDRALTLWQALLSCDSLAKWDETIMTQCGLPN